MGVAEKRGARDFVGIYSCNPWTPICVNTLLNVAQLVMDPTLFD